MTTFFNLSQQIISQGNAEMMSCMTRIMTD